MNSVKRFMELEKLMKMEHAEIFVNIKGYEGSYKISNLGNVKNVKTGRILRQIIRNNYFIVNLSKNAIATTYEIHRLVAIAFLPNPNNKKFVDHINNNRKDNNLFNLRFCTSQENNQNRKLSSKNTSGIKGVFWSKTAHKWRACICFNYKKIHIGLFDSIEDAKKSKKTKSKTTFRRVY